MKNNYALWHAGRRLAEASLQLRFNRILLLGIGWSRDRRDGPVGRLQTSHKKPRTDSSRWEQCEAALPNQTPLPEIRA